MIPRCTVGRGITGAARYVLGEGRDPHTGVLLGVREDAQSRVAWIGGTGFGFEIESREDADLARRVMEFDAMNQQSRTRQCEKDCVHLSLGWRPGETPTPDQMADAARLALAAMGMANARALFAIHSDTTYAHIHIVASKIDPATGRAYNLKENYLKLSKWAEEYERNHSGGVICAGREEANELRDAIAKRSAGTVLELMTKQRATFTAHDLDRVLAKQIKETYERKQFAARILRHREIVALSDAADGPVRRYTTKTVLDAEGHVLRAAQGLERSRGHGVDDPVRASVLRQSRFHGVAREQARAIRHATGEEGLALIDGQAGTGKSFTLSAIRETYEAGGYRVVGLAPTNAVAQDMLRDGFRHARTIHAELFALSNGRTFWNRKTVVVVDEAAMLDTKLMAMLTAHAYANGVKLILAGDDRQLSSIDRGGMFAVLKERYGAAELREVRRQTKDDDRRATELMAEGNFYDALARYDEKKAIHWTATQDQARNALVRKWAEDSAADPSKSRFVFAYTNRDVDQLNRDLRRVRQERGELGASQAFETKHGLHEFAAGDRIQFTGTDKGLSIYNGNAGIIEKVNGNHIVVRLDGPKGPKIEFDAEVFADFRHGYAGTIYKGQGRTLDQTYLYHSEHWRASASYVALSRHREKAELFVARETARDLNVLARQMARVEERRAASHFFHKGEAIGPVRPATPLDLATRLTGQSHEHHDRQDRTHHEFVLAAAENMERHKVSKRKPLKEKTKRKGKSKSKGKSAAIPKVPSSVRSYRALTNGHRRWNARALWRRAALWLTRICLQRPARPIWRHRHRDHRLQR